MSKKDFSEKWNLEFFIEKAPSAYFLPSNVSSIFNAFLYTSLYWKILQINAKFNMLTKNTGETWFLRNGCIILTYAYTPYRKMVYFKFLGKKLWNFQNFPGMRSHRYSVIFSADLEIFAFSAMFRELYQPTLILTSLVITDSVMNISEHLWFSAEHYWQAANRQRPWKKPKQVVFFNIDAEETRNRKFQNNF